MSSEDVLEMNEVVWGRVRAREELLDSLASGRATRPGLAATDFQNAREVAERGAERRKALGHPRWIGFAVVGAGVLDVDREAVREYRLGLRDWRDFIVVASSEGRSAVFSSGLSKGLAAEVAAAYGAAGLPAYLVGRLDEVALTWPEMANAFVDILNHLGPMRFA